MSSPSLLDDLLEALGLARPDLGREAAREEVRREAARIGVTPEAAALLLLHRAGAAELPAWTERLDGWLRGVSASPSSTPPARDDEA